MRLLMRADAHRPVATGNGRRAVEVAASPDSPRPSEPWQWHIRLLPGAGAGDPGSSPGTLSERVELGRDGEGTLLEVTVDPAAVHPRVEVVELTGRRLIERDERDLLALLVASGNCLVEDRHLLGARDAMVLEGDDPVTVAVVPEGPDLVRLAVVRLGATSGPLGWVP